MTGGAAPAGFAPGETVALRPGLVLPDWSVVRDPAARAALAASMAVAGRRSRWASLDAEEDAVRRAVLRHFAGGGAAPGLAELAGPAGLPAEAALRALRSLRRRDLLVLDADEARVTAAYPFSANATPHRVLLGSGRTVHALCAIDALGLPAMLGAAGEVRSRCAHCGAAVTVALAEAGRRLEGAAPAEAVVWSGTRYAGGCAAASGCALKVFACSAEHLEAWRAETDPGGPGFRLGIGAAHQLGLALFGPMLGHA